jgi:hypothetical protein
VTEQIRTQSKGSVSQIWGQLACEDQAGVIQLISHLVLKLIIVQLESSREEVRDEQNSG